MKVFISWSGDASRIVAEAVFEWLPMILQTVKPFVSTVSLQKGGQWNNDLAKELNESSYGILCVTPENQNAPWILFEAGALSHKLDTRVAPLLFGVKPSELTGPLATRNGVLWDRVDFTRLVKSINESIGGAVQDKTIEKLVEQLWPEIERLVEPARRHIAEHGNTLNAKPQEKDPLASVDGAVQEILLTVRRQSALLEASADDRAAREDLIRETAELREREMHRARRDRQNLRRPVEDLVNGLTRSLAYIESGSNDDLSTAEFAELVLPLVRPTVHLANRAGVELGALSPYEPRLPNISARVLPRSEHGPAFPRGTEIPKVDGD